MTAAAPSAAELAALEDAHSVTTYARWPLVLTGGEGCHVTDAEGRRFLDLYGGHCVASLGHCHPALVSAISEQAGRLIFYSNVVHNDARARAVAALAGTAPPGLGQVFLCNSGTEANETALKLARKHTGRKVVVSMVEGFHGRTLGSLGATGPDKYREPSYCAPVEHRRVPFGDGAALAAALDDDVAAVITEPVLSMGGIRVADEGWYQDLANQCEQHGALLIFDEVQTGVGRTGTWWFGEQVGVVPDLITSAKGLAGGVPAGAVLVSEAIAADVQVGDQGTTFGGSPLACAAIEAVVTTLRDEGLVFRAGVTGAALAEQLRDLPGVLDVPGRGLLRGVDLDRPAGPVVAALREQHGVLVGGSSLPHQLRLMPPLTITLDDCQPFVAALGQVLAG